MRNDKQPKTILFIDDEAFIREMAEDLMPILGYDVLLAESCEQAQEHLSRNDGQIHLAMIDLLMPKINGIQCCEILREYLPDIPVIFMSGMERDYIRKEKLESFRDVYYLNKPFSAETLKGLLEKLLSG